MLHLVNLGTVHTSRLVNLGRVLSFLSFGFLFYKMVLITSPSQAGLAPRKFRTLGASLMLVSILQTFSLSLLQSHKRPQTSENCFSDHTRQCHLGPTDEPRHKAQPQPRSTDCPTREMYNEPLPVMAATTHKSWDGEHGPKEKTPN